MLSFTFLTSPRGYGASTVDHYMLTLIGPTLFTRVMSAPDGNVLSITLTIDYYYYY